jgi:hypothetical protein
LMPYEGPSTPSNQLRRDSRFILVEEASMDGESSFG